MSIKKRITTARSVLASLAVVSLLATGAWAQTWTRSTIQNVNGVDYELWNQNERGTVSMEITGGSSNPNGGTFTARWQGTENVLFRSGKKWGSGSSTTYRSLNGITCDFAATWSSTDNVKMLGIYGWAYFTSANTPRAHENGQSASYSNQIEYYIIQDRGSWNPASGGTNAKKYGEARIDNIDYEFWVCDRIGQPMLTGNGNFKQFFSVPKSTSSHRTSGKISVSAHFDKWHELKMYMDGPLYEVAMKVESYTGSGGNSNGSATVSKALFTYGGGSGVVEPPKELPACSTPAVNNSLVQNGRFNATTPTANWTLNDGEYYGNSAASWEPIGACAATINITTAGTDAYQPQLVQQGISLQSGKTYTLKFTASAVSSRTMEVIVQRIGEGSDGWTTYGGEEVNLTSTARDYSIVFKMDEASDANAQLAFNVGKSNANVTISNVSLVEGGTTSVATGSLNRNAVSSLRATAKKSAVSVNFTAKSSGVTELYLYGLRGEVVAKKSINTVAGKAYAHTFNAAKLPNGVYVVSAQNGASIERSKVVVK